MSGKNIWIDRAHIFEVGVGRNDHQSHGIAVYQKSNATNLRITNSIIDGSSGHNIYLADAHQVSIVNNRLARSTRGGGNNNAIQANAHAGRMRGLLISGNEIVDCGGYGVCTSAVDEVKMVGNTFIRGTDPAIRMQGNPKNWIIANNVFLDVGSVGPVIIGEDPDHSHNGVFSGNVITGCKMWGLAISGGQDIAITGNTIMNNGKGWGRDSQGRILDNHGKLLDPNETRVGVILGSAKHIVVTGNRIGNSGGNDTQSFGILESGDCDSNLIVGNDLSGNAVGAHKLSGTGTTAKDNLGVEQE